MELGADPPEIAKLDEQFGGVWRTFGPRVGEGWLL
jgi:hypothetical protein